LDSLVYENFLLSWDKYGSEVNLLTFQSMLDNDFNRTSYEFRDHYLEFYLSSIESLEIRGSWQYKILQELSVYRKSTGEKETDMLKRFLEVKNAGGDLPEEWQRGIHMSWPHCAPNDFNVDLQIQRVNIC
jgi:hypothetical protein